MSSDKCDKCDRCYVDVIDLINRRRLMMTGAPSNIICKDCYNEWYNNGYGDIWFTFIKMSNYELADKLVFDFLGKLEQYVPYEDL